MREGLTFDDVALVPQFNNIPSRTEPELHTRLARGIGLRIPILAANMTSVIGTDLAKILIKNGSIPIYHRFSELEEELNFLTEFPGAFISVGVKEEELERIEKLVQIQGIVIDIAHGHSLTMLKQIETLKKVYPEMSIVAGNVCTKGAVHDMYNAGADAVKVGIGPGAACTTRSVTGFGLPQFTAIQECAKEAQKYDLPIIADGGIRNSRDIMLALAAGASSVMIGKMFALTEESAAKKTWVQVECNEYISTRCANYKGQASEDFQTEYYGAVKEGTVPEGESFWAPVTGSAQDLIDTLVRGIKSGLTYGGAKSISELQRKAEFIRVTPAYNMEMAVRK